MKMWKKLKKYLHKLWSLIEPFLTHLIVLALIIFAFIVGEYFIEKISDLDLKQKFSQIEAFFIIAALSLLSVFTLVEMTVIFIQNITKKIKNPDDDVDNPHDDEQDNDGDSNSENRLKELSPKSVTEASAEINDFKENESEKIKIERGK